MGNYNVKITAIPEDKMESVTEAVSICIGKNVEETRKWLERLRPDNPNRITEYKIRLSAQKDVDQINSAGGTAELEVIEADPEPDPEPVETPADVPPTSPPPSPETLPADDVLITPPPPSSSPVEEEPIITKEETDFLLKATSGESKPEMAEIKIVSCEKGKFAEAVAVLIEFMSPTEAGALLGKLDSGEKQTILVPKSQKGEALEKLTVAGFTIEVSEPIEPEIETPISGLTDKDIEAIVKVANQDLFVSIGDDFKKLGDQVAAIKIPETDVQQKALQDLTSQIAALAARIPEKPQAPVDLTPLSTQISATDKKVEEIKLVLMGGKDTDDNDVVGLKDQISQVARSARVAKKAVSKRAALIYALSGFLLGGIIFAVILHFVPPKISAKIDQKELQTTVQNAVSAAIELKTVNATVDIDTFVKNLSNNEEFKKLLTPAANAKVPGEPGGGATAPRTGGKH